MNKTLRWLAILLAVAGLAARVFLLATSGQAIAGPFSGTSDAERYVLLGENVYEGRGLTYAGQPTALRPPLYPLLLAGVHFLTGKRYLLAVRFLQFLVGLLTAVGCAAITKKLYGSEEAKVSGAIALAMPTLVFCTAEIGTECVAAGLTTLFLSFFVAEASEQPRNAGGLGITGGVSALLRFNSVLLPILGAVAALKYRRSMGRALLILLLSGVCVLPWVVRNAIEFRGRVLYSSHAGMNLLFGVLTPAGRAQPGETEIVRRAVGWSHTDIETNDPRRLSYPAEDVLDRQARGAALTAWKQLSWEARTTLLARKLGYFWLSLDQIEDLSSFSRAQRVVRRIGAAIYLVILVLGGGGWVAWRRRNRAVAEALAWYAAVITVMHLPFVMNTRLRLSLLDPLIAILAGAGVMTLLADKEDTVDS